MPSEVRRSREDSRWLIPRITGPMTCITFLNTERCITARSWKCSRSMIATRHGPSASMLIGNGESVIAAIAPIHVGPVLGFAGSLRPSDS